MPYPLTLEALIRKFYETIGPDRILFGSDSSWFPRGFSIRYLQDQIRACRFMNMPTTRRGRSLAGMLPASSACPCPGERASASTATVAPVLAGCGNTPSR